MDFTNYFESMSNQVYLFSWRENLRRRNTLWTYFFLANTIPTRYVLTTKKLILKFIYSEKATKFCEISTVDLSYVVTVKCTVEISQNFVAFSEYMNFT